MKRVLLMNIPAVIVVFLFVSFRVPENSLKAKLLILQQEELNLGFPENVTNLIKRSCFDCHSNQSKNIKAKMALNFSKWNEKQATAKIGKLNNIADKIEGNKMPPARYLTNNPDKVLSADEKSLMIKWTDDETKKLMQQ